MSKKNGNGGFTNKAAESFKRLDTIDLMDQRRVFEILDDEISIILDQVTKKRNHRGKFPEYMKNAFGNLSTALWFYNYVKEHVKVSKKSKMKSDLSEDDLESIRTLLASAYRCSVSNFYTNQTQEFKERNELITKAFILLYPEVYRLALKLKLGDTKKENKQAARELTVQIYGDPVKNMRYIHSIMNNSPLSEKKKLKLFRKMYGKKRFVQAIGAALCIKSSKSDFLATCYEYVDGIKSKKKRAPYLLAYVKAYKELKDNNFRLEDGKFYKKNKSLFKELGKCDIGFKKAYKKLKDRDKREKQKKREEKRKEASRKM